MYNKVKLVTTKEHIIASMEELCPDVRYTISGECMDYTIHIEGCEQSIYYDIIDMFEKEIYSTEEESTLAEVLVDTLMEEGKIISTAESCTGGLIASTIVDVANASKVFKEGFVTYSNEAKANRLGVEFDTLECWGAVSEETAVEMANGLLVESGADIAVATTGIAGPTGGSEEKPVGLVYIAVASELETQVYEMRFSGNRQQIRQQSCNCALQFAIQHIINFSE